MLPSPKTFAPSAVAGRAIGTANIPDTGPRHALIQINDGRRSAFRGGSTDKKTKKCPAGRGRAGHLNIHSPALYGEINFTPLRMLLRSPIRAQCPCPQSEPRPAKSDHWKCESTRPTSHLNPASTIQPRTYGAEPDRGPGRELPPRQFQRHHRGLDRGNSGGMLVELCGDSPQRRRIVGVTPGLSRPTSSRRRFIPGYRDS